MAAEGIIRTAARASPNGYLRAAREMLQSRETVEVHGVGEAITNAVRVADMLTSEGLTTVRKIETLTLTDPPTEGARKRAKIAITLSKAPGFAQALAAFDQKSSPHTS